MSVEVRVPMDGLQLQHLLVRLKLHRRKIVTRKLPTKDRTRLNLRWKKHGVEKNKRSKCLPKDLSEVAEEVPGS